MEELMHNSDETSLAPATRHPAYFPLLERYASVRSASRALAVLAQTWDAAVLGPLPSARTARHWAKVDKWDEQLLEAAEADWPQVRRQLAVELRHSAPLAIHSLRLVMAGVFPEPKMAAAAVRAALSVLDRCALPATVDPTTPAAFDYARYLDEPLDEAAIVAEQDREYRQFLAEQAALGSGNSGNIPPEIGARDALPESA